MHHYDSSPKNLHTNQINFEFDKSKNNSKNQQNSNIQQRYEQCLNKIFSWSVFRNKAPVNRSSLNLDQMKIFSNNFGNPHKNNFKIIHIAGTNGKGSVSLKTARCLQQLGFKTGLFISPHISTFRERIQINGELCTIQDIVETCDYIFKEVEQHNFDVRFFEIVTMIGLILFKKAKCDYVVLECGLGGKLDATNIVEYPEVVCSAITSIGMDHMDVLGNSLEEIASEKAGIIKSNIPCIVGPTCLELKSILKRAFEQNVDLIQIQKQQFFMQENNMIVENIMKIVCDKEQILFTNDLIRVIEETSQPCRMESVKNRNEKIILDVCHNIDGFQAVIAQIKNAYPQLESIKIVLGMSKSKKMDSLVEFFENERLISDIYLISRPHMRLFKVEEAYKLINEIGCSKVRELILEEHDTTTQSQSEENSESALSSSNHFNDPTFQNNIVKTLDYLLSEFKESLGERNHDGSHKQIVLVCGSFFIMSDVRQYFGFVEEIDSI